MDTAALALAAREAMVVVDDGGIQVVRRWCGGAGGGAFLEAPGWSGRAVECEARRQQANASSLEESYGGAGREVGGVAGAEC